MEQLMRSVLLSMAKNRTANKLAQKYGLRFGANRFVAGETIEGAIETVKNLNGQGLKVTLDHLGEFVADASEANQLADVCIDTIRAVYESGADATLSVKMTQLGMDIGLDVCMSNMRRILSAAKECGISVNIDMEDFPRCQQTLDIYDTLRQEFDNISTVIQAYLYRSADDVSRLGQEGAALRIVKGAYKEPAEVAYPEKQDVDQNYVDLMEAQLLSPGYTMIATHDEQIIDHAKTFVAAHNIPHDKYEFQMLYGIRTDLQQELVSQGYQVRVYVPYGTDWYGYFMRRLAERPANVGFVIRGVLH